MDSGLVQLTDCKASWSPNKGFSLLELMVVLVVLGIMASVAVPATGRFLDSLEFKKQTEKIMASVRYVRLKAVTSGKPLKIAVAEESNFLVISGAFSENRDVGLTSDDTLELAPAEIFFFPEGYATPGVLSFTIGKRSREIIIDPLTGLPILDYSDD